MDVACQAVVLEFRAGSKEGGFGNVSEAARGMKAEGLQHSGTGNGQDTVNAWFLVRDQEELGFIFHVWDVARGQGALNPSGMCSPGWVAAAAGRKPRGAPGSTAARPRAGASSSAQRAPPAKDSATTAKRCRSRIDSTVARRCRQYNKPRPSGWGAAGGAAPCVAWSWGLRSARLPGSRKQIQRLGSPSPG